MDASINKIKADIENRVKKIHSSIIGRKMAGIVMRRQKNSKPNFAENFFIEDFCIKCGICEKVCPIDNITIKNKVVIHDDCIRCGACYHNCPKGAIRYKGEKK